MTDLAKLLRQALPAARELVNSDDATARAALREAVGLEEMFEFSNIMNALCSERARESGSW